MNVRSAQARGLRHSLPTGPWRAKNLAPDRAQPSRNSVSLYPARPLQNERQPEFFCIVAGILLLVRLPGGLPARGVGQTGTVPSEAQLAEGIKLLGAGRFLESVKALNSAKQNADLALQAAQDRNQQLAGQIPIMQGQLGEAQRVCDEAVTGLENYLAANK